MLIPLFLNNQDSDNESGRITIFLNQGKGIGKIILIDALKKTTKFRKRLAHLQ
jgi:hypothetical protein